MAIGQSAVASIFGIFGTFWLSYGVLVLGLDHNWFAIAAIAVLATVKLFLLTWLIVIVMLTLATLRLPLAFTVVFVLVDLALLLLYLALTEPHGRRAVGRPAEDRRLRRAGVRRGRGIPVLRRGLGGHRGQAGAAGQADAARLTSSRPA